MTSLPTVPGDGGRWPVHSGFGTRVPGGLDFDPLMRSIFGRSRGRTGRLGGLGCHIVRAEGGNVLAHAPLRSSFDTDAQRSRAPDRCSVGSRKLDGGCPPPVKSDENQTVRRRPRRRHGVMSDRPLGLGDVPFTGTNPMLCEPITNVYFLLLVFASAADQYEHAQQWKASARVEPGMTQNQVRDILGEPDSVYDKSWAISWNKYSRQRTTSQIRQSRSSLRAALPFCRFSLSWR